MASLLILYIFAGLLMVGIAWPLAMEKIGPNHLYGFRVAKTLGDKRIWYLANSYAGFRLMGAGLATSIGAAILYCIPGLTIETYAWSLLALVLVSVGIGMVQSFRYLAKL